MPSTTIGRRGGPKNRRQAVMAGRRLQDEPVAFRRADRRSDRCQGLRPGSRPCGSGAPVPAFTVAVVVSASQAAFSRTPGQTDNAHGHRHGIRLFAFLPARPPPP